MRNNKPIFWHQGLFLQPQHFQATDQYYLYRLEMLANHALPYWWGVLSLAVDDAALSEKVFRINAARVVFPGGPLVEFPDNAVLGARSFAGMWTNPDRPLRVYLGLRRWDDNGRNVTERETLDDSASAKTMFCSPFNAELLADVYAEGAPAQVRRLSYVVQVFFEQEVESLGDYHLIEVARLVQDGGRIALSEHYVPPSLTLESSPVMTHLFDEIVSRVIQRCQQLAEFKNPRKLGVEAEDATYTALFLTMRSLNRCAVRMRYLSDAPSVHPWAAYGVLFEALAELSCFDLSVDALGATPDGDVLVPPYDHMRIWDCFDAMRKQLFGILDGLYIGPDYMVSFALEDRNFRAEIPPAYLDQGGRFWIIVRTNGNLEAVARSVLKMSKVGAESRLTALLARALPGLPLQRDDGPPPGVPRQKNALYFRIDTDHPLWEDVVHSGVLAMYWDQAPEDMSAQLVVLRG